MRYTYIPTCIAILAQHRPICACLMGVKFVIHNDLLQSARPNGKCTATPLTCTLANAFEFSLLLPSAACSDLEVRTMHFPGGHCTLLWSPLQVVRTLHSHFYLCKGPMINSAYSTIQETNISSVTVGYF